MNAQFIEFCKEAEIQQETTVACTPEQNGMAEARFRVLFNKVLFNKVRIVVVGSGAPKQLWVEAMRAMVYTYKCTLSASTAVTPFELWHIYKPDIRELRVFGSLCYLQLPRKIEATRSTTINSRSSKKRHKLDTQAVRGVFD